MQRAERRELSEQQRMKRHLLAKVGRDKFRRGVMGFFDKVTGREKQIRLINQKETAKLRQNQKQTRQELVFRHGDVRSVLQEEFKQVRGDQRGERTLLAKRIHEYRGMQERERKHSENRSIRPAFDRATQGKSHGRSKHSERTRNRSSKRATRTRERKPE